VTASRAWTRLATSNAEDLVPRSHNHEMGLNILHNIPGARTAASSPPLSPSPLVPAEKVRGATAAGLRRGWGIRRPGLSLSARGSPACELGVETAEPRSGVGGRALPRVWTPFLRVQLEHRSARALLPLLPRTTAGEYRQDDLGRRESPCVGRRALEQDRLGTVDSRVPRSEACPTSRAPVTAPRGGLLLRGGDSLPYRGDLGRMA